MKAALEAQAAAKAAAEAEAKAAAEAAAKAAAEAEVAAKAAAEAAAAATVAAEAEAAAQAATEAEATAKAALDAETLAAVEAEAAAAAVEAEAVAAAEAKAKAMAKATADSTQTAAIAQAEDKALADSDARANAAGRAAEPSQAMPMGDDAVAASFFAKLAPALTGDGLARSMLTATHDLLDLPELTVPTLRSALEHRFLKEVAYSYCGDVVVSVNPFKNIGAVGRAIMARYEGAPGASDELPPHIYGLCSRAYAGVRQEATHQSVIISGESGAGKTEAMKICLAYIVRVATAGGGDASEPSIGDKLMNTNPVMEALGNAKTTRNNNSSRFGKHFDVQFSPSGELLGAATTAYLLEKPRIVRHAPGERNYHVFYMLCRAPAEAATSELQLAGLTWESFAIMKQSGTVASVDRWDDAAEFALMHETLLKLGLSASERDELYRMLSIVMHVGNVQLATKGSGCEPVGAEQLALCAQLLQVSAAELAAALCVKTATVAGEAIKMEMSAAQAGLVRNSVCKHLYSLAFGWCVEQINRCAHDAACAQKRTGCVALPTRRHVSHAAACVRARSRVAGSLTL